MKGLRILLVDLLLKKNQHFRTLPIAVVGGLLICIIIYLLTNIAYFAILTPQQMLDSSAVATVSLPVKYMTIIRCITELFKMI